MDANEIRLFREVCHEVHPADEMFKIVKVTQPAPGVAFHYYFHSGGMVATRVADYLRGIGRDPSQLCALDFAGGYGRITRYFSRIFGEVMWSDLEPEMKTFVEEKLGVSGFLSNVDIEKVDFPSRRFDVVFSFSLFTHLNPRIWETWFWTLFDRVELGGLMMFSTRGVDFARSKGDDIAENESVRFVERNETLGRLDKSVYGQTTLAKSYVDEVISRQPGRALRLAYFKGGEFDTYQDMHVLQRLT